jgi:hypothetical protein
MTCAKTTVTCTIYSYSGRVIGEGTNACANPQPKCPRKRGEDYEKCTTVCGQQGHAEVQALADMTTRNVLGLKPFQAVVKGRTYACQHCQEALYGAGLSWLKVVHK